MQGVSVIRTFLLVVTEYLRGEARKFVEDQIRPFQTYPDLKRATLREFAGLRRMEDIGLRLKKLKLETINEDVGHS